jgi:quercetin dioxygenase-like cupin family protein
MKSPREGQMTLAVTRWDGPAPPGDEAILDRYRQEGLSPYRWGNGPGDRYSTHTHSYDKVLYCATGSITFVADGDPIPLEAGDRLDLPAGTPHSAIVGPRGCSCYEAHC